MEILFSCQKQNWKEKMVSFCPVVALGHQGFSWMCQHCHQSFHDDFYVPIFMPWRHPAEHQACSWGDCRVYRSQGAISALQFRIISKTLWSDSLTLALSQVQFHLSPPLAPHLSKGLLPAAPSAKFLQCSFQNLLTHLPDKARVPTSP